MKDLYSSYESWNQICISKNNYKINIGAHSFYYTYSILFSVFEIKNQFQKANFIDEDFKFCLETFYWIKVCNNFIF